MFSALITLTSLFLSVAAVEIQSDNPAFYDAGIQGCIAVTDNADGAPLIIHNCNTEDVANQDWEVEFFSIYNSGPEQITIFGDKCIDVTNGVNEDGTPLQIWTCAENNANQQWISVTNWTLQWNGTDKCIDLTDGSITDGNVLQIWTCAENNQNQQWMPEPDPDTVYTVNIIGGDDSADGGGPYCITAASVEDGAEVALAACLNTDFAKTFPNGNITWTVPVPPLIGQITTFNNRCLDVPNGSAANGVQLQIWTCTPGNMNQLFQTSFDAHIEWNGTGKCIDLTNGNSTSGNPIQMWDCAVEGDNPNQDWFLSIISE
ncbi:ricin B lectin domain-containing protein [Mycena sanguinolenta]|nr:ricin B lectin domain-containing protein [Mycena sanguinolenta]